MEPPLHAPGDGASVNCGPVGGEWAREGMRCRVATNQRHFTDKLMSGDVGLTWPDPINVYV